MKSDTLKKKSAKEMESLLMEKRTRLRSLRFELGNKKVKNVSEIGKVKKEIAQILTIVKEKHE